MDSNYRRMLRAMQEKEKKKRRRESRTKKKLGRPWLLYILKCADNSFYTGITNNLERRLKMHASGRASRYTRTRGPVELLYQEPCGSRTEAMVRECAVKAFPRKKKEALIMFPARNPKRKGRIQIALQKVNRRHGKTLKCLSK